MVDPGAHTTRPPLPTDSGTRTDPSADTLSNYDYRSGAVARPGLVEDLRPRVDGEVGFDEYSHQLYATDASIDEVAPIGVVFPRSTGDVAAVMSYCADREIPVLSRGGGTSLACQTVDEAVVLDFTRHMDELRTARPRYRSAAKRRRHCSGLKPSPDRNSTSNPRRSPSPVSALTRRSISTGAWIR